MSTLADLAEPLADLHIREVRSVELHPVRVRIAGRGEFVDAFPYTDFGQLLAAQIDGVRVGRSVDRKRHGVAAIDLGDMQDRLVPVILRDHRVDVIRDQGRLRLYNPGDELVDLVASEKKCHDEHYSARQ